jgi:hypothetical protein
MLMDGDGENLTLYLHIVVVSTHVCQIMNVFWKDRIFLTIQSFLSQFFIIWQKNPNFNIFENNRINVEATKVIR